MEVPLLKGQTLLIEVRGRKDPVDGNRGDPEISIIIKVIICFISVCLL